MIYEGTIQYLVVDENGNDKVKKETYLMENYDLFGDVERWLYDHFASLRDMEVVAIKRSKITEVANFQHEEKVYVADLESVFVGEDGVEKITPYKIALYACDFEQANERIGEYMKQGYSDISLVGLRKTRIQDIL